MPTDYSRGKIYKIVDLTNNNTYIGSTCEPTLARRLSSHVSNYKRWKAGTYHFVSSYKVLENGNYDIQLIEKYPCNQRDELHAREGYHIKNTDCVNKIIAGQTKSEYNRSHPDKIREYCAKYYTKNAEKKQKFSNEVYHKNKSFILSQKSEIIHCPCGSDGRRGEIARHKRSKKHQKYELRMKFIADRHCDISELIKLSDEKAKAINQTISII